MNNNDLSSYHLVLIKGYRAFFVQNPRSATGDDWNDRFYYCNAGRPYGPYIEIAFDGDFVFPEDHDGHHDVSVDRINSGVVPWLQSPRAPRNTYNAVTRLAERLFAHTTIQQFITFVFLNGGRVYIEARTLDDALNALRNTLSPENIT